MLKTAERKNWNWKQRVLRKRSSKLANRSRFVEKEREGKWITAMKKKNKTGVKVTKAKVSQYLWPRAEFNFNGRQLVRSRLFVCLLFFTSFSLYWRRLLAAAAAVRYLSSLLEGTVVLNCLFPRVSLFLSLPGLFEGSKWTQMGKWCNLNPIRIGNCYSQLSSLNLNICTY